KRDHRSGQVSKRLVAACDSAALKYDLLDRVVGDFLDDVKTLCTTGLRVMGAGVEKIYFGGLFFTLGDYPAQQSIHGRKESVAAKTFCPCCDVAADNYIDSIDQIMFRNVCSKCDETDDPCVRYVEDKRKDNTCVCGHKINKHVDDMQSSITSSQRTIETISNNSHLLPSSIAPTSPSQNSSISSPMKKEQRRKFGLLKPRIRTNTKSKLNLTQHINKGRNMVDPDTQLLVDNSVATMRDTALSDFDKRKMGELYEKNLEFVNFFCIFKQMDMNDEEVNLITTGNAYEITIETSRDHDASDVITEQPENLISLSVESPKLNMRDQSVVEKAKKIAANAAFSENQDPFESDSQHTVVEKTKPVTRICTPTSVRVARSNRFVIGVDTSQRMVDVYNEKCHKQCIPPEKMHAVCIDLLQPDQVFSNLKDFNVVVTSLAYHHLEDIDLATRTLVGLLKYGGSFLIVDLIRNEKQVNLHQHHAASHTVAHLGGFEMGMIEKNLKNAGLV
ncbi:unnamed protein product, partial [Didymodactylos carnosus]